MLPVVSYVVDEYKETGIIHLVGGEDIDLGDDSGLPLVDLQTFPGVKELNNDVIDSFSDPIHIPSGLFFGDNFHSTVYVRKSC